VGKSAKKGLIYVLTGILLPGLILVLFFAGKQGESAQKIITKEDREEIWAVIRNAVEDNTWWEANNRKEVKKILAQYYAEPLLDKISNDAWNFISQPTDWYWQAHVKKIIIRRQIKDTVLVHADLELTDLISNQIEQGKAEYVMKKTKEGWRIHIVRYQWPRQT
jgi:hypothetical protein